MGNSPQTERGHVSTKHYRRGLCQIRRFSREKYDLLTISKAIDSACDFGKKDDLLELQSLCGNIAATQEDSRDAVYLNYYLANISSFLASKTESDIESIVCDDILDSLFLFRKAFYNKNFADIDKDTQCGILCNLGNTLAKCGRVIEAVDCFYQALNISDDFGMAHAFLGDALCYYLNF